MSEASKPEGQLPLSVLFIDDEAEIVSALVLSLEMLGCRAEGFTSPAAVLERLASDAGDVDCVITDYTFPEMTCADFVAKVRAIRPDIPIHLCTGNAVHEIQDAAGKLGIAHILYKPFDFSSLERFVGAISSPGA